MQGLINTISTSIANKVNENNTIFAWVVTLIDSCLDYSVEIMNHYRLFSTEKYIFLDEISTQHMYERNKQHVNEIVSIYFEYLDISYEFARESSVYFSEVANATGLGDD